MSFKCAQLWVGVSTVNLHKIMLWLQIALAIWMVLVSLTPTQFHLSPGGGYIHVFLSFFLLIECIVGSIHFDQNREI